MIVEKLPVVCFSPDLNGNFRVIAGSKGARDVVGIFVHCGGIIG